MVNIFPEAQERRFSWAFRGSILAFPEENGLEGDPMPIMPSPGAAAVFSLIGPLEAELSLDLYGYYYGYSSSLERPIPVNPENRSSLVIGSILALQLLGRFDLGRDLSLRVFAGPAADLRLCLIAGGLEDWNDLPVAAAETEAIRDYFWSQGRWFLPSAGLGVDYRVLPLLRVGLEGRIWVPLYRFWGDEALPPLEGWRFGGNVRISLR